MAQVYQFTSPATESAEMSLDFDGAAVQVVFYDAMGAPVNPIGHALLHSRGAGFSWHEQYPFAADEWRFNGPCRQVRIDLSGVTGYTSYRVYVWRCLHSVDMTPTGSYTGESAAVMQTYIEMNAKRGVQYEASRRVTGLSNGAVLDSIILTDSKPLILKQRLLSYTGDGIIAEIFEAPAYTGGVADPYFNLSRINPVASGVQLLAGPTLSVIATGVKTFADDILIGNTSNQGRGGTDLPVGHERIFKPNTAYLLRQTMLSAQDISAYITWYSGRLDAPFLRPEL